MPERTAAQEYEWLISREEHRKPIDAFFADAIAQIMPDAYVLELGPGPCDDIRAALAARGASVIQADTRPANVGIAPLEPAWSREQRLPWTNGTFTDVLAREVFEHVFHLHAMIAEVHRVLTPGGTLWMSTPFAFPLHDYEPELSGDFWRLSPEGWVRLLTGMGFWDLTVEWKRELFGTWQMPITILARARK